MAADVVLPALDTQGTPAILSATSSPPDMPKGLGRGYFFVRSSRPCPLSPPSSGPWPARGAFGYTYPNYDVLALAERLCPLQGWRLAQVRFYTGIPSRTDDPRWHHFWSGKLVVMGYQGIHAYSRPLRYHAKEVKLSAGGYTFQTGPSVSNLL